MYQKWYAVILKVFFLFLIKWIKFFSKFLTDKFLSFIACGDASGKPPLLEIITAHPQLDASRAVLPKGSLFLEQTTAIDDLLNHLITNECFLLSNVRNVETHTIEKTT